MPPYQRSKQRKSIGKLQHAAKLTETVNRSGVKGKKIRKYFGLVIMVLNCSTMDDSGVVSGVEFGASYIMAG